MRVINDPDFGELVYDGFWVRDFEITFLGIASIVELIIQENDTDGLILEEQRLGFSQLPEAIPVAEEAIFRHYQSIRDNYAIQFGDDADVRVPKIENSLEMRRLVTLTGIVLPLVLARGEVSLGFLLECSWDPEHGLGVKITDGKTRIGEQDLLT